MTYIHECIEPLHRIGYPYYSSYRWRLGLLGTRGAVVGVDQRLETVCRLSKAAVIYILSRLSSCLYSFIVSDTSKKPDADVTAWRLEVEFEV
jgi:hypothetical protein